MHKDQKIILIIDDDISIYEMLGMHIDNSSYQIKKCNNSKEILRLIDNLNPHMIIIGAGLGNINEIEILKFIRKNSNVPIIMLSEKHQTFNTALVLDLGADDCVVKPFDPKELVARIRAILRRYNIKEDNKVIRFNDLEIYLDSYSVIYKGSQVKMPPKEFELLYYLIINKNKVFTREHILCKVWGYDYPGDSRTVDVHIKRLRHKLNNGEKWCLKTVWGVGYKFEVKSSEM